MESNSLLLLNSVLIYWTAGLLPALVLRYAIYERPLLKRAALLWTLVVFLLSVLLTNWLALLIGVGPHVGPVVLWTVLTYWILHRGYDPE